MRVTITTLIILILVIISGGIFYFHSSSILTTPSPQNSVALQKLNLVAGAVVGSVKSPSWGEYLTDTIGIALYTFADDKKLQSMCTGDCLKNWRPVPFDTNQNWATITDTLSKRIDAAKASDGSHQAAYGSKPLYYYINDKKPGDVTGNGLDGGKWKIVPVITR